MPSSKSIGDKQENRARTELEEEGFVVYRPVKSGHWQKQVDIFGLFDLIAINKKKCRLIQVKTNRGRGVEKVISEFQVPKTISKELWVWYTKKRLWKKTIIK